ncbi:cytochrome c biogenesis protein ResB [Dysgonomonas sp. ZJ709]|uniref:cytochrome c biogenesis protein ResB n=1 Tax=Dysgonomonas sp. ZJ709 TaxID=2709797 RepID=UPI0021044A7F|nr:cytochrome c biogenesis protein ResB [Dysgonomonas sp. ZJ709]
MEDNKRKMWQFPWRYKESIALVGGIIVIGFILQLTVGKFNFFLLSSPVNLIVGAAIILFLIAFSFKRKNVFYQWFSGVPFSVTLITAMLLLALILGLTPQLIKTNPHDNDIFTQLGFRQVTSSWSFVLVYFLTLLSLGSLIARRLVAFKKKDYAFYMNHIGLWILLFAAGLGSADMKRYVMHVYEGEVEWRVFSDNEDVLELPIAIQLNDFYMEEYPPKLAVINRESGTPQPEAKPEYVQIDEKRPHGNIDQWDITLEKYIHDAVRNSDSTYQEVHMPGASPAALVKATNKTTGEVSTGWVCCGNTAQLYMTLNLDSTFCVVMTQPEPKRFVSDIDVFTEDGKEEKAILEVNKPLKIDNWVIYQYGYDNQAGKMSNYSSMELVYDPWIYPVYLGIILLAIGSICLLWSGNKKTKKENDLE